MRLTLTLAGNRKLGKMPVSITSSESCPDSCPLLTSQVCYAKKGPLSWAWTKLDRGLIGLTWKEFTVKLKSVLRPGMLWRHNQAGDLPGIGTSLDMTRLHELVEINQRAGARGFTFTHKTAPENLPALQEANRRGFVINLSADSVEDADRLKKYGPVVVTLPVGSKPQYTPAGNYIAICPAIIDKSVQCRTCQLCAKPDRRSIVGFPLH